MHINFTGVRFVPQLPGQMYYEHFHRYAVGLPMVNGKDVLDIACGEGYGAAFLATVARSVIGVDIDEASVRHAAARYPAMNLSFRVGSASQIPLADASVDVITSFETIEHLAEHEQMLYEMARILRPDGHLLISSPNRFVSDARGYSNPFHVRELYFHEFRDLLRGFFPEVHIYGQRIFAASAIHPIGAGTMETRWIGPSLSPEPGIPCLPDSEYFVAVCGRVADEELPNLSTIYLDLRDDLLDDVRSGGLMAADAPVPMAGSPGRATETLAISSIGPSGSGEEARLKREAEGRLERRTASSDDAITIEDFDPDRPNSFDTERDDRVSAQALSEHHVDGHCNICGHPVRFVVSSDVLRENVVCPHDGCIGRYRAVAAVLSHEYFGDCHRDLDETIDALVQAGKHVYLTETNTSVYRRFQSRMPADLFEVSEFFGDEFRPGERVVGVRHENLEETSFEDGVFDLIITSEVMEHVPDTVKAEREIIRLLRPGGAYVFTVPLDPYGSDDTILSLKHPDGTIEHFGEPVYHGDPSRQEGVLAYRIFAVRALERRFRALGCSFKTYRVWSNKYGILGNYAWVHVVRKGERSGMTSGIADIRERALAFREELQKTKLRIAPESEWYPYDSLSNFVHLDTLLRGDAAGLLDDIRGWTIADIGAADGDVAFFLESLGASAVDIIDNPPTNWNGLRGAALLRDALSSRVEIHPVDLDTQFRLPRENYSLIVFLGILYHLKNPFYILETLSKVSQRLLLSTRITRYAHDRATDLSNIPVAYLVDRLETNNDPTNFWIFSDAGLRRIIDRAGWEIDAYLTVGNTVDSNPTTWEGDERAYCLLRSRNASG